MTTPEKTGQDQLRDIAFEYGWRVAEVYGGGAPRNTFRYRHDDRTVTVTYTKAGTVREASFARPGLPAEKISHATKDKWSLVDKWLRKQ